MLQAVTGNLVLQNFTKNITPPYTKQLTYLTHVHSKHFVRISNCFALRVVFRWLRGKQNGIGV